MQGADLGAGLSYRTEGECISPIAFSCAEGDFYFYHFICDFSVSGGMCLVGVFGGVWSKNDTR